MPKDELIAALEAATALDPYGAHHPAHAFCPYGVLSPYREPWIDGYNAAVRKFTEERIAALRATERGEAGR